MDCDTFLDATRATVIPGILPTLNLKIKIHPSSGCCIFSYVMSESNYHNYKEKTVKILPFHNFYGGHIPSRKIEPPFLAVCLKKKNAKPQDSHLAAFP